MSTEKWKQEHVEELRAYRRKHYHRNKKQYYDRNEKQQNALRKFVRLFKKKSVCKLCGEKDSRCLDFHHKNPEKKESAISRIIHYGWSIEHLKKEIAKCVVICANCHRKKHLCKVCNRLKSNHSSNCRFYRSLR